MKLVTHSGINQQIIVDLLVIDYLIIIQDLTAYQALTRTLTHVHLTTGLREHLGCCVHFTHEEMALQGA